MPQPRLLRTDDFTGGLNLRANPFQLGRNESPDLLNIDIDPRGGIAQRGGFVTQHDGSPIGGITSSWSGKRLYNWATGSPQLLVSGNGKVFYSTSGGAGWTDTTIATTAADGASFASWAGASLFLYVACGTGSSQMAKWSGSAKTLLTASGTGQWQESLASPTGTHMPRCDFAVAHVGKMWVASTYENGTAFPNRVRWSHPFFPESWRSADYIDIPGGGSAITAIVPFGDALIVFKQNSIHAIYGDSADTLQVQQIADTIGAPSSNAVCATESGLYFFDWPSGLFRFDGRKFEDLFVQIRPLIDLGVFTATATDSVWVGKMNARIWLSVPTDGVSTPTYTYVFDPVIKAWTRYQLGDGSGLSAVTDYVQSDGTQFSFALHPSKATVMKYQPDAFWDSVGGTVTVGLEEAIVAYYTTPWMDAGVVSSKKMWRRPDLIVQQPDVDLTLTVQVFHNWEESVVKRTHYVTVPAAASTGALEWHAVGTEPDGIPGWGEAPWGATATGAAFTHGSNLGLARSIQLKITGPAFAKWGINSVTYKYLPRRIR